MLVLTRKAGETIRIGNDVLLTVVRIEGNRVRIAVEAPRSLTVLRGELSADGPVATERLTPTS
jgi:carbon storage regulator